MKLRSHHSHFTDGES